MDRKKIVMFFELLYNMLSFPRLSNQISVLLPHLPHWYRSLKREGLVVSTSPQQRQEIIRFIFINMAPKLCRMKYATCQLGNNHHTV